MHSAAELQPTLTGDLLTLRSLRPEDWDELFAVASDPLIWEQHPERERYREEIFRKSFEAEKSHGKVLDRKFDELLKQAKENPDAPRPLREIDL